MKTPSMITPEELVLVKKTTLFSSFTETVVDQVLSDAETISLAREQLLFEHGHRADSLYVMLDGWVKMFRTSENGAETVLAVFTAGDTFGEGAAFTRDVFAASAIAATNGRVLKVPVGKLRQEFTRDPELAISVLSSLFEFIQELMSSIERRDTLTATQRLANFLLPTTEQSDSPITLLLPHDKRLLAGRLGMTPESLSRAFGQLRNYGVKVQGSRVTIMDQNRLRRYVTEQSS